MEYKCTEERFLDNVKDHQMTVLRDDGVYRHLIFKQPDSVNCYFNLITWPGNLCIAGDMGTYVFNRVEDMFTFFRRQDLQINPGYWAEKCTSQSVFGDGIRKFSLDVFERAVKDDFKDYINYKRDDVYLFDREEIKKFGQEMRGIWSDIKEHLFGAENEWEAMDSVYRFDGPEYLFQDFWETSIADCTFHFLWCLYAIVWGIQQYDASIEAAQSKAS